MDVVDALDNLFDDSADFRLFHSPVLSEHLQKLAPGAVFYQKIHVQLILEVPVEWSDVSVR